MGGTGTPQSSNPGMLRKLAALRRQEGMSLVGVLVALAITGGAVVMLFNGLSTGSKGVAYMYERTTAENVARSQLEYTKSLAYVAAPTSYESIVSLPSGFTVSATASSVADRDDNIQKITVTVYRDGEPVMVKEGFKVNR